MPRYACLVFFNVFIALRIRLRRRVPPAEAATVRASRTAGPCDGYLTLPLPDLAAAPAHRPGGDRDPQMSVSASGAGATTYWRVINATR